VFDDRYGCPDLFELVRCKACGHVMTSPSLAEEELASLYSTYYPRKQTDTAELAAAASKVGGAAARLQRWLAGTDNQGQYSVRPGQIMLDVGCGNGLSLLEGGRLGAEVLGIEADPNVRSIAEELGLRIHIGSLYDQPFPDMRFDLIVLNQVIEHMPEPGKTLAALKERLKPGGRVVLSFPNRGSALRRLFGAKWINWHIPYHLHHFDAQGFESLARRHGYRVLRRRTITPNVWTILQLRTLLFSPSRGVPNPLWDIRPPVDGTARPSPVGPRPVAPKRMLRRFLRLIGLAGMTMIGRGIDIAGYGDSVFVELGIEGSA
jgi:2-polyprenyl-3-methyl-5-hydroxy-6-metoxy-1,4-benzoquinol methylase